MAKKGFAFAYVSVNHCAFARADFRSNRPTLRRTFSRDERRERVT